MSQSADLLHVVMLALSHCRKRGKEPKGWLVAALDVDGGWTVELQEPPPPVVGGCAVDLSDWSLHVGVCEWNGREYLPPEWKPVDVSLVGGVLS